MISYYQVLTLTALHTDVVAALDQDHDKTSDIIKIYFIDHVLFLIFNM